MDKFENVELKPVEYKSPVTTVGTLRKLVSKMEHCSDETEITSDLILSACFPTMFENMMSYGNECHTQGYIQGYKDGKGETNED